MLTIKDAMAATRRQNFEMDCELLWVKLASLPFSFLAYIFYNPPKLMIFSSCKTVLLHNTYQIVLYGDFNLHNIKCTDVCD